MSRFRGLMSGFVLALALVAQGYDGGDDYTQWMTLKTSASKWDAKVWYDPADASMTLVAPVAGKCYYVPSPLQVNTPGNNDEVARQTFAGEKLAIGGTYRSTSYRANYVKEYHFLPGSLWTPSSHLTANGEKVYIKGTTASPATFKPFLYGENLNIWYHDFYSDYDAELLLTISESGSNAKTKKFDRESAYASYMQFRGDWSGFNGLALITTNNYVEFSSTDDRVFGGKLKIEGGYFCYKPTSGQFQIATLEICKGGELRSYGVSGSSSRALYVVTNSVSFTGPAYIFYEGDLPYGRTPIIKLTDNAAKNPPNLTNLMLSPYSCSGNVPEGVTFMIDDNGDGTKSLVIVRENKTIIHSGEILSSTKTTGTEEYDVLVFEDDTKVYFRVPKPKYPGSVIHVVNQRLELNGTTVVGLNSLPTNDSIVVFRLSAAAVAASSINLNQLQFDPALMVNGLPDNPHAEMVANDDGTADIRMIWTPMKHMIVANSGYSHATSAFNPANASYWADGELPSAAYNGTVFCHDTLMIQQTADLKYPNMSILCWPIFTDNAGTATRGADPRFHVSSLTMKGLHLLGSASHSTYSGPSVTRFNFPIYFKKRSGVDCETMYFFVRDSRRNVLNEPMDGDQDVYLRIDNNAGKLSWLEMVAPNTNFTGRIIVTSTRTNAYPPESSNYGPVQLILHDARNLGGAYSRTDGLNWKSLEVDYFQSISNAEDVVFNDSTRGMYVKTGAYLDLSDRRFEIDVPITYGGEIRKRGEGVLSLGGEAKFADASGNQVDAPVTGLNVLNVIAGALCVTATNAIDGVTVNMSAGTRMLVNPALMSSAAKQLGAISCRDGSAFVSAGSVDLAFDESYVPSDLRIECGVLTVPAERAEEINFNVQEKFRTRAVQLGQRENADGTVTFYLTLAGKDGFLISFEQD